MTSEQGSTRMPRFMRSAAQRDAKRKPSLRVVWQQHWMLYVMLIPAALLLLVFNLYPLWGISIAFVKYNPVVGVMHSPFVGLEHFVRFFSSRLALEIIRNTLVIAIGKILIVQLVAIVFALMLHDARIPALRRVVQSATTLPHFLSWVIIGGIMVQFLGSTGPLNQAGAALGFPRVSFLGSSALFPVILILSEAWKEFGWSAVIYLAALANINPELHEAAAVDGAGRWARLWAVTIPGIMPIIALMSCLSLGGVLNAGFEQVLVLINPLVSETGEILDTFVYRVGLLEGQFSFAAAVGLFKSSVGFLLILLSYWLAERFANYRIF